MKRSLRLACFVLLGAAALAGTGRAEVEQELLPLIKSLKPSVVNIDVNTAIALGGDVPGNWSGTGFIVDAAQGWVATNRHIVSRSPAQYKINFYDGQTTAKVRLLYYDAWADLAILKFDTSTVHGALTSVTFGDPSSIKEQEKVFLVGNNEGQNYTILYGEIMNTTKNPAISDDPAGDSHRHTSSFQVVYGTRGGSSGSPVFDHRGKVIGLQCSANETTGDALKISYVADALRCLRAGQGSCRGDIGVVLDLIKISDAENYLHLPKETVAEMTASGLSEGDVKDVVYVRKTIPNGPADDKLESGDVIFSVGGKVIGNSLYAFDREIDRNVSGSVPIKIIRAGRESTVTVAVQNADINKISRFVSFGGGVFHEATPELRRRFAVYGTGVIMNQADPGSSLDIGSRMDKFPLWRQVLVQAINGSPISDLDQFIAEAAKLKDEDQIYVTARDFVAFDTSPKIITMNLNLKYQPLKQYRFSPQTLAWEELPQANP